MGFLISSAGVSIVMIAIATLAGWMFHIPSLTTWLRGSVPMAPATAASFAAVGASLVLCGQASKPRLCIPGIALSLLSLVGAGTVVTLRLNGQYSPLELLGFASPGLRAARPIGLMSPFTAANIVAASIAFLAQVVPALHRKIRLGAALAAATVTTGTGFATLLTRFLGEPLIAGGATVTIAVNTSVTLVLLGAGLAAVGIRLADRTSRRAETHDRSWRPLGFAFLAIVALTIAAGYAFYLQEEREIHADIDTQLDGIQFVATSSAEAIKTKHEKAGLQVRLLKVPDSDRTLVEVTDGRELRSALWERLRWVLSLAAMLLVSAAAILALVWRTQRAVQYRNRAELAEAVRIQAARMSELAARSPAVLYTLKRRGNEYVPTNLSSNVERILGYSMAEAFDREWFPSRVFPADAKGALAAPDALAAADESVNEFRFLRKDGSIIWISNHLTVIRREDGVAVEVAGAWHDITARRAAESALRESEERLRLALSSAAQGLWDLNVATGRTIVSPEYALMLGYNPEAFQESSAAWQSRLHPDDYQRSTDMFRDYVEGRLDSYVAEYRQRSASGEWKWILSRGKIISRAADGRPLRIVGTHMDTTARKTAELQSAATLLEREALLKEVHHRVKNNLQVISSLLRLERDRHDDASVKSAMSEMQLRIQSMALLHETLYRSVDLGHVDLAAYLSDLGRGVFRSSAPAGGAVQLKLRLASALVDMDRAIPCGLLVNEILSNCLKHAFPGGRRGTVAIDLVPGPRLASYLLRISDDGVGLPEDFETRRSSSLGVHLIRALARQLGGSLLIDRSPGASFSLAFSTTDMSDIQEL